MNIDMMNDETTDSTLATFTLCDHNGSFICKKDSKFFSSRDFHLALRFDNADDAEDFLDDYFDRFKGFHVCTS